MAQVSFATLLSRIRLSFVHYSILLCGNSSDAFELFWIASELNLDFELKSLKYQNLKSAPRIATELKSVNYQALRIIPNFLILNAASSCLEEEDNKFDRKEL